MERTEFVDSQGRYYVALTNGGTERIIVGPPEGLVDSFNLPEPFATNLHNVLYRMKVLNYQDIRKNPNLVRGALQEVYGVDAAKLTEAFFNFEKEVNHEQTNRPAVD